MKIFRILFLVSLAAEIVFFCKLGDSGVVVLPSESIDRNPMLTHGRTDADVPLYLPGDGPTTSSDSGVATGILILAEVQRLANGAY